jgi:hypothetical protein
VVQQITEVAVSHFFLKTIDVDEIANYRVVPGVCCYNAYFIIDGVTPSIMYPDGDRAHIVSLNGIEDGEEWFNYCLGVGKEEVVERLERAEKLIKVNIDGVMCVRLPSDICGTIGCVQYLHTPYMIHLSGSLCAILYPTPNYTEAVIISSAIAVPLYSTTSGLLTLMEYLAR